MLHEQGDLILRGVSIEADGVDHQVNALAEAVTAGQPDGFLAPTKELADARGLLQTTEGDLAWYGYEGDQLSVWFYAGPGGTKPLRKKLEKAWPGMVFVDGPNVGVHTAPEKVESDQKFFAGVLGTIFLPKER